MLAKMWGLYNDAATTENNLIVPRGVNTGSPCCPAAPLPGICPGELRTDTCMLIFITAFFTVVKVGNNPTAHQQTNKQNVVWYEHTLEYYLAIESNEILILCYNMDELWKYAK